MMVKVGATVKARAREREREKAILVQSRVNICGTGRSLGRKLGW